MMPFTLLCRALAVCACLLLAFPTWGATEDEAPSTTATPAAAASNEPGRVAEAQALMEAGRFMEAVALLGPLVQGRVILADTLFLFGLATMAAAQQPGVPEGTRAALLDQAIRAFHAMLVQQPGVVRVRLELARAFFLAGRDELAQRHFEAVLAGGVPQPVATNVQRFLDRIRGRGRWRFNLGAALAPDSNIGSGSDERTIHILGLPFQRDAEELTTSGIGLALWGGAEYQVRLGDDLRLRAGGQFSRREYAGSQFDQFFLAAHLGPRWLVDGATEVSLLPSVQQRWSGTVKDHHALGARLEVGHRVSQAVTVSGRAAWHGRRYRTQTNLDGPVWDASLRGSWVVTPTVRTNLTLGYGRQRPGFERNRNESRWLGAGVDVILPLGFTVGGGGDVRWTDFEPGWRPFVPENGARKDRTHSLRASVHHRAFTLMGFSPELVVVREERKTNAQAHDYERTRGELRFVQQF